jgi:hypothetical protein
MWWNSKSSNSMGGLMVARMFVRMIFSLCNLIKRYCYAMDCPSWALVMMMILIVKYHFAFIEF